LKEGGRKSPESGSGLFLLVDIMQPENFSQKPTDPKGPWDVAIIGSVLQVLLLQFIQPAELLRL